MDGEPEENETVTIRFTTMSANVQDFDYNVTVIDATGEGPTVLCLCIYTVCRPVYCMFVSKQLHTVGVFRIFFRGRGSKLVLEKYESDVLFSLL